VSDVTKRMAFRLIGLLVVVGLAAAAGLTLLRPKPAVVAPVARPPLAGRVPGAVLPSEAADVLATVGTDAPVPSAAGLRDELSALIAAKGLGSKVSVDILDPLTGEHLLSQHPNTPRTPASTAKLLTAAAALTALGPETTLPTTVVTGSDPGRLVLVGGGDVLLDKGVSNPDVVNGHAGLTTLAQQTATALKAQGTTEVQLALDDRLFSGPAKATTWDPTDVSYGFVAPIQPLELHAGRLTSADYAPRSSDPAMAAARVFAGLLEKRGIKVSGTVRRRAAPKQTTVLAEVRSAPISGLVEYALTQSDNTVAETLGRLVAADAGRPASFREVGPAVLKQNKKLGVPVTGAVLFDGSGLSDGDKVPALALSGLLAVATAEDQPQLRSILSGMPIAGVSGTLTERYSSTAERPAVGMVRAKTGTLTGVSSLAGTVVDADGRLLVFAVMADHVSSTTLAREALDKLASTIATCGCR
jgi:D-alanyl-D-alanine carboxypeptidase/D-alanyl-D-alanine-endopeptidase (penicillin-binding protein 4)